MLGKLNDKGDTIIEVMVVLAILGLAIGISYATANRSLLNARQAQENAQATELVQSQVEQLRTLAAITNPADPNYIYQSTRLYCLTTSGTATTVSKFASLNTNPESSVNYPNNYPAACVDPVYHLYHLSIKYGNSPDPDTFTAEAVWDDVTGQGHDTVTFVYKVHKPL